MLFAGEMVLCFITPAPRYPVFVEVGRKPWLDASLRRLRELEKRADKTAKRRIALEAAEEPTLAPTVKPSRVKAPSGPESVRRPGKDIVADITPRTEWLRKADAAQEGMGFKDEVLTTVVGRQAGWSEPARVVAQSELDRAIDAGWVEMWRGVREVKSANLSAGQIAERVRTGDWEMGRGIYGNGVYATVRRTTAETYRNTELSGRSLFDPTPELWGPAPEYEWLGGFKVRDAGRGGLIRIALDPDAKIADYEDLKREHLAYLASQNYLTMPESAYKRSMTDSSFYGAARGYDGVRVHGPMHNDGSQYPPGVTNTDEPDQYIIFNRSVLIMEQASRRYDT